MRNRTFALLLAASVTHGLAQSQEPDYEQGRSLVASGQPVVTTQPAAMMVGPMKCDADGNVYVRLYDEVLQMRAPVKKIDAEGQVQASFAIGKDPEFQDARGGGQDFFISSEGDFYQLATSKSGHYIVKFGKDGSYKSKVKLEPGLTPFRFAAFPEGEFLLSGLVSATPEDPVLRTPLTVLIDANGKVLRRISLDADEQLEQASAIGDSDVVPPGRTGGNRAVNLGSAVAASDGNVYLMRWTSPAVLYGISAGGEVVRKMTVDPGIPGLKPLGLHAAEGRLAVMFRNQETREAIFKVVSLATGDEVATYQSDSLGPAFICYSVDPERFTFLTTNDGRLAVMHAEPR